MPCPCVRTDALRWGRSRYLATARPDQNGRFSVRGLPPGRYLAVAVDHMEAGDQTNPDYLESMRPRATKVTIGNDGPQWLDLRIVTVRSASAP